MPNILASSHCFRGCGLHQCYCSRSFRDSRFTAQFWVEWILGFTASFPLFHVSLFFFAAQPRSMGWLVLIWNDLVRNCITQCVHNIPLEISFYTTTTLTPLLPCFIFYEHICPINDDLFGCSIMAVRGLVIKLSCTSKGAPSVVPILDITHTSENNPYTRALQIAGLSEPSCNHLLPALVHDIPMFQGRNS